MWSGRENGTALAWFRIALASIVFVDQLTCWASGALDPLYVPVADGGLAPFRGNHMLLGLVEPTAALAWTIYAATLVFSAAVAVGLGGRIMAFLLLQSLVLFHGLPVDVGGGYDRLLTNGLFLLVLGDATRTWSLDCWLRTGAWTSEVPIRVLARYLGVFQLCLMYTVTGFAKRGASWSSPYDAVWYALQRESWSRWGGELPWLAGLFPLTQLGTVVAWWWEASFFVLGIWFGASFGWLGERARGWAHGLDLRWPYLGVGVVMHVVLAVFMNLGTFPTVTLAYYLLAGRGADPSPPVVSRQSDGSAPNRVR